MFLQSTVNLNLREKDHIEKFFKGPTFPWFWQDRQTINDDVFLEEIPEDFKKTMQYTNGPFLSHVLLPRNEDENIYHLNCDPKLVSPHFEFFAEIFNRFMKDNQQSYKKIFRANLNLTWYNGDNYSMPHKDHAWPHYNFIMYLTTCENAETIIWSDSFDESWNIPCVEYTAATFYESWHAQKYPKIGKKRLVFVATYI